MILCRSRLSLHALLVVLGLSACHPAQVSRTKFIPTEDPRVGLLEDRDLNDEFGLAFSIVGQEGLGDMMLALSSFEVSRVRLEVVEGLAGRQLRIYPITAPEQTLLTFNLNHYDDSHDAIDFASVANSLALNTEINKRGGEYTNVDSSEWKSIGEPETLHVQQDADTFVADVRHRVQVKSSQTTDSSGTVTDTFTEGSATIRLFLRRLKAVNSSLQPITAAEARQRNFGFFVGSEIASTPENMAIQRFAFDPNQKSAPQINFFLKDVPAAYAEVTRSAVLAWNKAFGWDVISVQDATAEIDIGDPRFHVIRWLPNGDSSLGFAGLAAPHLSDAATGVNLTSSVLINGSIPTIYEPILTYSENLKKIDPKHVIGRIGNVPVHLNCGETPLLPFITDVTVANREQYLQGYYFETIMHEVGHSLGLTHNFKASTELEMHDGVQDASSVMDYAPRWNRNRAKSPGSYDIAAIRWAYFGEEPTRNFAFCDDLAINEDVLCNTNDWGYTFTTLPSSV